MNAAAKARSTQRAKIIEESLHIGERKIDDLQIRLSKSIRSRDEAAAAAMSSLPTVLRPHSIDTDSIDNDDFSSHIPTSIEYRLLEPHQPTSTAINVITQSASCESKLRHKSSSSELMDDMSVLPESLESMESYMPVVDELAESPLEAELNKKVCLSDSNDSMDAVLYSTCNNDSDDKRRKRTDKCDDRNKKKKLKPLEEENLSKWVNISYCDLIKFRVSDWIYMSLTH